MGALVFITESCEGRFFLLINIFELFRMTVCTDSLKKRLRCPDQDDLQDNCQREFSRVGLLSPTFPGHTFPGREGLGAQGLSKIGKCCPYALLSHSCSS